MNESDRTWLRQSFTKHVLNTTDCLPFLVRSILRCMFLFPMNFLDRHLQEFSSKASMVHVLLWNCVIYIEWCAFWLFVLWVVSLPRPVFCLCLSCWQPNCNLSLPHISKRNSAWSCSCLLTCFWQVWWTHQILRPQKQDPFITVGHQPCATSINSY